MRGHIGVADIIIINKIKSIDWLRLIESNHHAYWKSLLNGFIGHLSSHFYHGYACIPRGAV